MRFWIWTLCIAPLFAEVESRPNPAEPVRAIRNETFVVASLLYRKTEDGITLLYMSGKTAPSSSTMLEYTTASGACNSAST